jgi:thiamine biosynthesis lipoprotein
MQHFGFEFAAMASRCEVRVAAPAQDLAERWARAAIDEVRRVEVKFSRYRDDSIVTRINRAAGASPVECDDETASLLAYAGTLYQQSDGLFDITSGVLRRAWDFRAAVVPTPEALAALLPLVGWSRVERDARRVRLPAAGMEIDFGGFGKEYAADRAAGAMQAAGAVSGFVDLGGDIRALGPQPDGAPWTIAIQHPRRAGATVASIPIACGAVCTSGDYERYFERDGRRYCHILNPRTGMPVQRWQSITVVAPLAVAAGSLTTIGMLLESDAPAFLARAGLPWLSVDRDGTVGAHQL